MAHDNQYKDNQSGIRVLGFDRPKRGQKYWDRVNHRVVEAQEDLTEKYLIVEKEGER